MKKSKIETYSELDKPLPPKDDHTCWHCGQRDIEDEELHLCKKCAKDVAESEKW